jgi:hypothetical protein
MQPPAQELQARDIHDNVWTFRHIFRGGEKKVYHFHCYKMAVAVGLLQFLYASIPPPPPIWFQAFEEPCTSFFYVLGGLQGKVAVTVADLMNHSMTRSAEKTLTNHWVESFCGRQETICW